MKTKFKFKKVLSILLTAAMILTVLPAMALAATHNVTSETELRDAIINANDGDIISIDAGIALTGDLSIDKKVTLTSGSPSTLDATNSYYIDILTGANVTFGGNLIVTGAQSPVIMVSGEFTLEGSAAVKQTSTIDYRRAISVLNGGKATITGNAIVESTGFGIVNNGTLTVSGGTVNGNYAAIDNYGPKVTISSGAIGSTANDQNGIRVMAGTAEITGGNILGKLDAIFVGDQGTVNISGGTFAASSDTYYALNCGRNANLTGGSFTTGKISTYGNGAIYIDLSGGGSLTLPTTGVFYYDSGRLNNYLTELPTIPPNVTVGQQTDVPLTGAHSGVVYAVVGGTSADLGATVIGSGSTTVVHLNPTAAGSKKLVLKAPSIDAAATQFLQLILPVTVSSAAANICEIGATQYATLDDALAAVTSGQTIRLLDDITYTEPIVVDGKVITFDLGNYNLSLDTSANVAKHDNPALMVTDGGKVRLAATGTGKFNVKGYFTGVDVVGINSEATVNNVTVTAEGACAVSMVGSGGNLDGGTLTVNGDIKAEASNSVGIDVNAKNGKIIVNGDIAAGQTGISTSANPGTEITVNGNLSVVDPVANSSFQAQGIRANALTTVRVTGNVSVSGVDCIGVYAYGATIIVNGDVTSSGIGAQAKRNDSYGNGTVTIDGCLSAGSPFVIVGNSEKIIDQNKEPTTKVGYITYTDGVNSVWAKRTEALPTTPTVTSVTVTPATVTVQKGNTQSFSATVNGTNNPAQTVTWSVSGANKAGTTISASGLLTVAADETAETLTVTATSAVNTAKSGTAAVTVAAASDWQVVGSAGFSADQADYTSIAIDSSGTPYVAYADWGYSNKATVMKYDGNNWVTVGSPGFSAGKVEDISIALNSSGTPYVAYKDFGNSSKATVMKYDGSNWVTVGNAGFSTGWVRFTSIALDSSGTPYVAYTDQQNSKKATVMKYEGGSWVIVGDGGFSAGESLYTSIALDSVGTPYVAYQDMKNSGKATVMKFSEGSWQTIGNAGFSAGTANYTSIVLDDSGTPYVAYAGGENFYKATVMKYNGSSWETVGSAGFSEKYVDDISIALDSSGTPYVAYADTGNAYRAIVVKYDGSSWVTVGSPCFSADAAYYLSIALDSSDTPYVVYGDYKNLIKATVMKYKALPTATLTVTFSSDGSVYAAKTVNAGNSIGSAAWPADPTRSGYTFGGWFTGANGSGTQFTSATPVNAAMTVYAKWTYSGGSGGVGGGGGGGGAPSTLSTPSTPTYKADVKAGNNAGTAIPVAVDKNAGTASVDAGSQNLAQGGTVITMPSIPGVDTYSVGIPVPDLSTTVIQGTLTLNTDMGSVTVPSNMLTGVAGINGDKAVVSIGEGNKAGLRPDVKAVVGDRPLVQLTLSIDGKRTNWNNPKASVTVSIPYQPTAAELANSESIIIWYIDGSGNAVSVPNGHYDPVSGTVTFTVTHFSEYAVGYNKVNFNDVASNAWYNKAVSFIAARGITSGKGNGDYSPDAKLTRGEFIVLMMRAYGITPDANPADNFADAGNTYYTGYLAAAKRLGIAAGVGNNLYAPGKEISRQEMFTLLYNALKTIGQLPQGSSGKTFSDFNDVDQVASWAKDAMTLLVKTGTISGNAGKLTPLGTITRAEMAQVLYNLLGK